MGLTGLFQVEDGRLHYDRKWYGRYQNVFVEGREFGKIPAVIQAICSRLDRYSNSCYNIICAYNLIIYL